MQTPSHLGGPGPPVMLMRRIPLDCFPEVQGVRASGADCIRDEGPRQLTLEVLSPLCAHGEVLFEGVRVLDEVVEGGAVGTAV